MRFRIRIHHGDTEARRWRAVLRCVFGAFCCVTPAAAQTNWPGVGAPERAVLAAALDGLNMTTNDPGFAKDVAEPRWALQRVRRLLEHPLEFPDLAAEVVAAAENSESIFLYGAAADWLELEAPTQLDVPMAPARLGGGSGLDPYLADVLHVFVSVARRARVSVDLAVAGVTPEDRVYAAASTMAGTFLVGDHPELRPLLVAEGCPELVIEAIIAEDDDLDPEPGVRRYLGVCEGVKIENLMLAAGLLHGALDELQKNVSAIAWPTNVVRIETDVGMVVVGTTGDDSFAEGALLILDPGGDDVYRGGAGSANGLLGNFLGSILELGGDDRYEGEGLLGAGAALFGVAVVVDCAGDDVHRDAFVGAGAGLFGVARVEDLKGDDAYRALALGQGAGVAGVGVLRDGAGQDRYDLGYSGQGYAGVRGVGLLVDSGGNDRYAAGGHLVDWDRNEDRYLSMAQGFATGMRPYAGGGIAALVDLDGNDAYEADVFGQGAGYWYGAGMLLDRRGQDTYHLFQYGQGSGIHLSLGLLADGGGRDAYTGYILCQGNAHDYAVGLLLDRDGDDTYSGDHHVQGRAINNAFGLLLDGAGNDAYFARQPDRAQGIGEDSLDREYGSLALLLDLAGADRYTCGAKDGVRMERPDFGMVYDVLENTNAPGR